MDLILQKSLTSISQYVLFKSPDSAMLPDEFLAFNNTYTQETMISITKKSIFLEKTFLSLMKLILYRIHDKYSFKDDDKKYEFFNVALALEDIRDSDIETKRYGKCYTNKHAFSCNVKDVWKYVVQPRRNPSCCPSYKQRNR